MAAATSREMAATATPANAARPATNPCCLSGPKASTVPATTMVRRTAGTAEAVVALEALEALEAEAEMAAEQPGQRDSRHQLATTPSWFKTSFTQPS